MTTATVNRNRPIDGLGLVAGHDNTSAWNDDGRRIEYGAATLVQLRQLAGYRRLGSGVWRAGASKADLLAALRGENVSFDVAAPAPVLVPAAAPTASEPANPPPAADLVHRDFEVVFRCVEARVPVWLVGPAGTGKTTLATKIAKRLNVPFYARSVSQQTTEASLMGFIHANGECVRTPLREAFEHGGVFLLDECDAGSPAVMVILNSLVGNRWASFPDGMIEAHPDFRIIAGANCFGTGADRQYVGRQQQDAAMLDRFAFVELGYDQRIIRTAMGLPPGAAEAPTYQVTDRPSGRDLERTLEKWHARVLYVAARIAAQQIRAIVGARAAILGAALLRNGVAWDSVERMLLQKGQAPDVWSRIK